MSERLLTSIDEIIQYAKHCGMASYPPVTCMIQGQVFIYPTQDGTMKHDI